MPHFQEDCVSNGAGESKQTIGFEYQQESSSTNATDEFNTLLSAHSNKIMALNLKQNDTNSIYEMSMTLLKQFAELNQKWMSDDDVGLNPQMILELTYDIAHDKLSSFRTQYKRDKIVASNEQFVQSIEKAIGTRWELKTITNKARTIRIPRLLQCTLQYVPILGTLKSLFACEEFASLYFDYNNSIRSHTVGRDGSKSYRCFSSGRAFANCELFRMDCHGLQLQISVDEFEPCNALQSKSNRHKICAIYFTIHNLPAKYTSKLNNIYLVCLCNSDDLKSKQTDFNNIWQLIVDEIEILESEGIMVGDKKVRGTLVHTAFDNLGANVGLGFSGSFSSNKFCRHCLSSKAECRRFTSESECTLRTVESYEDSLAIVDESESVNLDITDGVKFYCVLSNLKYYHILDNPTADIMHDINEGCIPKLLKLLFEFCFKHKIFSKEELDNMVKCYDFGTLNNANVPSEINLKKRSLGQNASQAICLFRNLPFILNKYKNHQKLEQHWKCVEALLQICEIVTSYEITELDIQRLEEVIQIHLDLFKSTFKVKFIPKQHFLLHYPGIIRTVGPLRYFEMMRYDAKHKTFKNFRNATNNFKNLNKSLAYKHQKTLCGVGFTYKDNIEHGVLKSFDDGNLLNLLPNHTAQKKVFRTKYVHFNNYRYSKGLIIVHEQAFFGIVEILYEEQDCYLISSPYIIERFDSFLNSFEVKKADTCRLTAIKLSQLQYPKSHELRTISENDYVISESLDLRIHLNE